MKPIALVSIVLCCTYLSAQEFVSCRQLVATSGETATVSNYHISYSIGETAIGTLSNNNNTITQGFHQPERCISVEVKTIDLIDNWRLSVFPNPTRQELFLQWQGNGPIPLYKTILFDANGQLLAMKTQETTAAKVPVDIRQLPAGAYVLQIVLADSGQQQPIPFIIQE